MTNRTLFLACALLSALSAATLFATEVRARDAGPHGGGGGGNFRSECRPNDALIGVNLMSGAALDAVVSICIPLNPERTEWAGQAYEPTQYWGGPGGGYQKIACQPGDVVRALRIASGPWSELTIVKHIAIECRDLGSSHTYQVVPGEVGGTVHVTEWVGCNDETEIGSGIFGGSGTYVDRIGLICANVPRPSQPAPRYNWDIATMQTQIQCIESHSACENFYRNAYLTMPTALPSLLAECLQARDACLNYVVQRAAASAPAEVVVVSEVTGYAQSGGGGQECHLYPGDRGRVVETQAADPKWVRVAISSGNCAGKEVWIYNDGELR